jgi:hypothetical protein
MADGGACPDITGGYDPIMTTGAGCGDLDTTASECITAAGATGCDFQLASNPGDTGTAVTGTITLAMDGSFSGAALTFGTAGRSGCTGQWDAGSQTLTLDCGGVGSSQSCIVTMVLSSSTCM